MSDIRVCERDGEPLVFTFEYRGAEYVCVVCGGKEGVLGERAGSTPERVRRLSDLTVEYERDYADRHPVGDELHREYREPSKVGDPGIEIPVCKTCNAVPPDGVALNNGKPASWYSRTHDGVTEYACKRSCIPERETILPW